MPLREFPGRPGKDGIPAIDEPRFLAVDEVDSPKRQEPVIALEIDADARAYPLQILIWHEIVNDVVRGVPVAVTFCPLCSTAIVFDRRLGAARWTSERPATSATPTSPCTTGKPSPGGSSSAARHSSARTPGRGSSSCPPGSSPGAAFEREYRDGRVLSRQTGHARPYGQNPYPGYDDAGNPPFFHARNSDDERLAPKERVVFIEREGDSVAIPFSLLERRPTIRVVVGGHRLVVRWRPGAASALDTARLQRPPRRRGRVREHGKLVPSTSRFGSPSQPSGPTFESFASAAPSA